MYSKEELKRIKIEFWEAFRTKMQKKRSSNGRKINWINYPTGIEFVYLRCNVDSKFCQVSFDIQAKDEGIRSIVWEQLEELKKVMELEMGDSGIWKRNDFTPILPAYDRIFWQLDGVNYLNKADMPVIFAFFEEKLTSFDKFYQEFKDILINLVD